MVKKGSRLLGIAVVSLIVVVSFISLSLVYSPCLAADKNGVSPNTISLPKGPGSIEGLGGAFQPMLNTGMANYEVEIAMPAGVNGHTPQLSLQYNSGLGDGPAGIGWSFGPGCIKRQTEKGIPRYVDGPNGVDDDHDGDNDEADEADRFIGIEGEELVPLEDGIYRARIEGTFIRYRKIGDAWEAHLKDGTKLEFGLSPEARVSDNTGAKIFKWLLEKSTDTNGNVIEYLYCGFPGSDNQKYLKEIRYGPGAGPWNTFYFASLSYEDRPDWRKDYRSGFLIKTAKRLAQVDVGIQGVIPDKCTEGDWNKDEIPDALIRTYAFSYGGGGSQWSFLTKATRYGSDGISYLPPIFFSYSIFDPGTTVSAGDAIIGSTNEPPSVMDNELVELVDLNRDGLPDILKTELYGGSHTCSLNLGMHEGENGKEIQWDTPKNISSEDGLAWFLHLSENQVYLADMDGDGISDLVQRSLAGDVYYYKNEGDLSWASRKRMSIQDTAPPAPFGNTNVKTSDLDFDKRIDIVKSSEYCYSIWFNLDSGKYSREVRTLGAVYQGQAILLSSTGVHLADMNGDRMNDIVKVTPMQVIYCANMGHGHFDTSVSIPIPDQTLTDGPDGQVGKAQLQDINGDGLADLVIERAEGNELWYWVNLGTDTLSKRHTITDMPVNYNYTVTTRWADINGNGTTDLIYADSFATPKLRTLDIGELVGGSAHPNMLTAIDNGLGVITSITYKSTTEYYLKDNEEGAPWSSTLPFPASVVAMVETTPSLDLDDIPGTDAYIKEYRYRDGYYDDIEKTFWGFGEATVIEHGDSTAPTQVMHNRFFTGGPDGDDNDGDGVIDEISMEGYREDEPLKGKLREIEIRSEEGCLFTIDKNTWSIKTLLTNQQGIEIRFAYTQETNTLVYEGTDSPKTLKLSYVYDDFGNITEERDYGALSITGDEVFTYTTYINDTGKWILDRYSRQYKTDASGQKVMETLRYYDGDAYIGLGPGSLDKGNLSREEGWVTDDTYVDIMRNRFDSYGNIIGTKDGNGNLREIVYDNVFHAYPIKEIIYVNGDCETLAIDTIYNLGLGAITRSDDFNGNPTYYDYDCFGRLTKIIKPGDSFAYPTVSFLYKIADPSRGLLYSYDEQGVLTLTSGGSTASSITTKKREDFGKPGTFDSIQYIDGMKRELATIEDAEDGFTVKNAALFNAKGATRFSFLPYFTQSPDFSKPTLDTYKAEIHYDATGREITTINPPDEHGAVTQASTEYQPLLRSVTDENGITKSFLSDGLERLIEVHEQNDGEIYITRYEYDPLGNLVKIIDAQNNIKTMSYDGLGRKTRMNDPDSGRKTYEYDSVGNLIRTEDTKSQVVLYTYDGANRLLSEDYLDNAGISPDVAFHYDLPSTAYPKATNLKGTLAWIEDLSGAQFSSYDARGNVVWSVKRVNDGRCSQDYMSSMTYDAMDLMVTMTYPDGDEVSYVYNSRSLIESIPGFVPNIDYHASGQIASIDYANSVTTHYSFDPRHRLIQLTTRNTNKNSETLQDLSYTFDGVSNITDITDGRPLSPNPAKNATQNFRYDDLYRLIQAEGQGYGRINFQYDKIGNMTCKKSPDPPDPKHVDDPLINLGVMSSGGSAGTSDRSERKPGDPPGPHAITGTESGLRYDYDDNGNMISHPEGATYSWDFKDRLVKVQNGNTYSNYVYDFDGRRIKKEVHAPDGQPLTLYICREYEIREGKPVKYLFAGDRRIARIEGKLPNDKGFKQQRLALHPGWNFFSLEIEPVNPAIDEMLQPIEGAFTEVCAFDAESYQYISYAPSEGIFQLKELHAHQGYLIHVSVHTTLLIAGSEIQHDIVLKAGWNLIGCPSNSVLPIEEALSSIAGDLLSVWSYENCDEKWEHFAPNTYSFLNELTHMEPGRAYWVEMKKDGSIPIRQNPTNIFFYHPDHLGSTNLVMNSAGEVVEYLKFYPFGRLQYEERDAFESTYKFTGKETDEESGLMYFGARYYEPVVGRFVSIDPKYAEVDLLGDEVFGNFLVNPQKINTYSYVLNNPINLIDLWGLEPSNADSTLDKIQRTLDIVGCADPTPIVDLINATIYASRGKGDEAGLSAISAIPYIGDVVGKGGKAVKVAIKNQGSIVKGLKSLFKEAKGLKSVRTSKSLNKSWKNLIEGKAHGTGAHKIRSYREAIKMTKSGQYEKIYINKSLKTATGGSIQSGLRPDVTGVLKGGKINVIEVPSPSQTSGQMMDKILRMEDSLGDLAGSGSRVTEIK